MSSHHIVREKQEPALLVLGLDGFDDELFGQLLEWSPTVIATLHTAEKLNAYGIKIDWVIANDDQNFLQSDLKLLPPGTDNPPEAALKYLISNGYPAVNIVTDDLQLKDYMFFADKIGMVIFHDNKKIYAVAPGFSKWKPAGERIELLSLPQHFTGSGLQSIGPTQYQTTHDGFITLQFDTPFLFIAEEL